jgi:nitrogen-specific signal transduction histidine kinase
MNYPRMTELETQVAKFKAGIKEIAHEMNNTLGVLRTAMYLLEANKDAAKQQRYLSMVNTGIDRLEADLKLLRALRDNPTKTPSEPTPPVGQQ